MHELVVHQLAEHGSPHNFIITLSS